MLSVVEYFLPAMQPLVEPPFLPAAPIVDSKEEAIAHAETAVAEAIEILSGRGLELSSSVSTLSVAPKTVILDEAERWSADLIALGSHGRRGVERFLMGSVAESVAAHAHCSVEVVR